MFEKMLTRFANTLQHPQQKTLQPAHPEQLLIPTLCSIDNRVGYSSPALSRIPGTCCWALLT